MAGDSAVTGDELVEGGPPFRVVVRALPPGPGGRPHGRPRPGLLYGGGFADALTPTVPDHSHGIAVEQIAPHDHTVTDYAVYWYTHNDPVTGARCYGYDPTDPIRDDLNDYGQEPQ